ncbi:glycosyltransferase [Flavobacterium ichthyis]|uniref:glycosyltransferase n=1 Tax=Flavobacterium ichthyis TaxID=2698827 RepID=UPI001AA10C08
MKNLKKNILVAPLNWGLGHATRCIPIIQALQDNGFNPIIASDGEALRMLQKEFPNVPTEVLPSYKIQYAKKGVFFKWKMIVNMPKMILATIREKKTTTKLIKKHELSGIISDNRLGVFSKKIPSVFITHQLNVLTGNTTAFTSLVHQKIIKKFTECWIPDVETKPNLSGKLGHLDKPVFNVKYIGPLSRLHKKNLQIKYQLMVILSGPEPQRTLLEEKLLIEIQRYPGKILFVKGKIESKQIFEIKDNVTFYNYMNTEQLENAFNQSEMVLCRSGYTTIMDLAQLGKKAFFIPTPGQYEQVYLAKKLKRELLVPYAKQNNFKIENLEEVALYKGLKNLSCVITWNKLFGLFQGK